MEQSEIYELCAQSNKALALRTAIGYFHDHFVGLSMKADWRPPNIRIEGKSKPVLDFVSWMHSAPVVSEKAKDLLLGFANEADEFLPLLVVKGVHLFALNVTRVLDCLDLNRSTLTFDSATGKVITGVRRFHFELSKIPSETNIFKVPQDVGHVFVRRRVIDLIKNYGLHGAMFQDPRANPFGFLRPQSRDIISP